MFKNCIFEKYLELNTRYKITFFRTLKNIIEKIKTLGLFRRFQPVCPRSSLITMHKIWPFSKILTKRSPFYLFDFIPNSNRVHNTRIAITSVVYANHDYLKNSFFLQLHLNGARLIWVLETHTTYIINFIRFSANNSFDIHKQ